MEVDENSSPEKSGLMTTLQNLFSTTNPSVKKLMGWRLGEEEGKWAERAIESLVKRLRKKRGALEELERAVSNPDGPSKCITIERSLDGRIQVSHRKGHPHVIYCKLWRWPDLQSHHELRPVNHCKFPFSARHSEICINPYHYRRVEHPNLPAIMVSKAKARRAPSATITSASQEKTRPTVSKNVTLCAPENSYAKPEFTPEPMVCSDSNTNYNYTTSCYTEPQPMHTEDVQTMCTQDLQPAYTQDMQPMYTQDQQPMYTQNMQPLYSQDAQNTYTQDMQPTYTQHVQNNTYTQDMQPMYNQNVQNTYTQNLQNTCTQSVQNTYTQGVQNMYTQGVQNTYIQGVQNTYTQEVQSTYTQGMCMQNTCTQNVQNANTQSVQSTTAIPYVEPSFWASIAYYELNSRVGEIFECSQPIITVDGYTNPSKESGRFCLGTLSNVNRNSTIENTRRHIGRGVQLHYFAGQVFVECISEQAIFVQSINCNYENGLHPTTVIKVPSGSVLKIFDNVLFSNVLAKAVMYGYEGVFELTKMCTIRMSFVKGWGANYHRHDVTATPSWIEIHLNGPLRWLDNVITGLGAPHGAISSVS